MVLSAALLIRERGAKATSIDAVLAHSGSPRGSIYHHFPGGRDELLRAAIAFASDYVAGRLAGEGTPVEKLDAFVEGYRTDLVANDFRPGCPIVAVAIEDNRPLQNLASAAFHRWEQLLTEAFGSKEFAVTTIAALEGALVMSRAAQSVKPLDIVHQHLRNQLEQGAAA